jgi:Flp pilus assembly protein TadG
MRAPSYPIRFAKNRSISLHEISCSDWAKVMIGKTSQKAKTENFLTHCGGSIAVIGAFTIPFALFLTAGVIDFAVRMQQEQRLQAAADSATLAAAQELSLSDKNAENVVGAVEAYLKSFYGGPRNEFRRDFTIASGRYGGC